MNNDFKKKIQNFDNVRVMPAWDALVSRQQQELERMRVPAMFNTTVTQDRKVILSILSLGSVHP